MFRKPATLAVAFVALAVVACARNSGSGLMPASTSYSLPSIGSDLIVTANLPPHTIGEELPGEGVGQLKSAYWHAQLAGFTQMKYSQALGFPPGTKITIRNLSKTQAHTLDVIKTISGPPAYFPSNPQLSVQAKGNGKLELGYASGPIKPGKSVTITLAKDGIYMIGCAFHYHKGMRDILRVAKGATPGPQATAPSTAGPSPTPTSPSSWAP
jgi:plastocyanin